MVDKNAYDCTPVPLPQSLRGVSVALGLGGGTSPHLCVCSEKPRRGFQSSPAPENRERTSSVRQTLGDQAATRGHCEVVDGPCTPNTTTTVCKEEILWKNEEYYWKPWTEQFPFTVGALLLCVLQGLNG